MGVTRIDTQDVRDQQIKTDDISGSAITPDKAALTASWLFQGGLSGSLQQTFTGLSYLVAGSNVTIITGSNGQLTISATAGSGADVDWTDVGNALYTTSSVAVGTASIAQVQGNDVKFFVSGSSGGKNISGVSLFGGDVQVSGTLYVGSGSTAITSGDIKMPVVIIGDNAAAQANTSIAVGQNARARGTNSIALGADVLSFNRAVAIGHLTEATTDCVIIGTWATGSYLGGQSIAIGTRATGSAVLDVTIGYRSEATANSCTAVGAIARSVATNCSAFGYSAQGRAVDCTAIGAYSDAVVSGAICIGYAANVPAGSGLAAYAFGAWARARGRESIAFGPGTATDFAATGSIAIGQGAYIASASSIAIGQDSRTTNINSIAIGASAVATGNPSIAIGRSATTTGNQGTAVGQSSSATGTGASAFGYTATAASDGIALGSLASATAANTLAVGRSATTTKANQAIFGSSATVYDEFKIIQGANAQSLIQSASTVLTTLDGISTTANVIIPANTICLFVSAYVTGAISGPARWRYGVPGDPARWGNDLALSGTTSNKGIDANFGSPRYYTGSQQVIVTPQDGVTAFTAGTVRFTVHYIDVAVPTS